MKQQNITALKLLVRIFWTFFKLGPVSFGGGYAMIPLIEKEIVDKQGWIAKKDVADMFSIAGAVPGAIAVNAATFTGYKMAGLKGAFAALLGILLPTFLIVIALCVFFTNMQDNRKVHAALQGIGAATVALIVFAGIKIGRTALLDKTTILTACGTLALLLGISINPVFLLIFGCIAGIGFIQLKKKLGIAVAFEKRKRKETDAGKDPDYFFGDGI